MTSFDFPSGVCKGASGRYLCCEDDDAKCIGNAFPDGVGLCKTKTEEWWSCGAIEQEANFTMCDPAALPLSQLAQNTWPEGPCRFPPLPVGWPTSPPSTGLPAPPARAPREAPREATPPGGAPAAEARAVPYAGELNDWYAELRRYRERRQYGGAGLFDLF